MIGKFGDRMRPGDIYMANDPYSGGTHLSDVGIVKPIFIDDELLAFGIAVAHWTEIGGSVPGSPSPKATEIFLVPCPTIQDLRGRAKGATITNCRDRKDRY